MSSIAAFGIVVPLLAVGVVVFLVVFLSRPREDEVAWVAGSHVVPSDEAEVYRRYLARHRRYRALGGLAGGIAAAIVSIRFYGDLQLIGASQRSPFADVFFGAIVGIIIGALLAESYRLRQPRGSVASASLAPREAIGLPRVVATARGVAVATLAWGVLTVIVHGADGAGALGVALGGLVLAGLAEATRLAVTNRRRPASTARALHVDARIRAFAGRTTSWLQLAAAVLTATWTIAQTPLRDSDPLATVVMLLVVGGLVTTIVLVHRASPRPSRRAVLELTEVA